MPATDPTTFPELDVLLPPGAGRRTVAYTVDEHELADFYAHPQPPHGVFVRANMVSTLDGAAWGPDHKSGTINNTADFRAFRVQRALADVVLIGAGTARTERYTALDIPEQLNGIRAAAGCAPQLQLAVVTRTGGVPATLTDSDRPPLIVTTEAGAQALGERVAEPNLIICGQDRVDLTRALTELADRGLQRVLTEGGPHLLASLLQQDLVDELCLTFSPLLAGSDAGRIVQGYAPGAPLPTRPAHLLHAQGVLLGRWRLENPGRTGYSSRSDGPEN